MKPRPAPLLMFLAVLLVGCSKSEPKTDGGSPAQKAETAAEAEPQANPAAKSGKAVEQKITPPTKEDWARIAQQERDALRILKAKYGEVEFKHDENDLALLQRAIDDKMLGADQTYELQCLGIVLGQVFAAKTPLEWVTIEDEFGRDPAVQYPDTTILVFPMTMISKRVEDGREVDVAALFRTVAAHVEKMKDDPEYKGKQGSILVPGK